MFLLKGCSGWTAGLIGGPVPLEGPSCWRDSPVVVTMLWMIVSLEDGHVGMTVLLEGYMREGPIRGLFKGHSCWMHSHVGASLERLIAPFLSGVLSIFDVVSPIFARGSFRRLVAPFMPGCLDIISASRGTSLFCLEGRLLCFLWDAECLMGRL